MKALILITVLLSGCSTTYLKVGTGYKLRESDIDWRDGSQSSPLTARIELFQRSGGITYGVSHHSQWLQGWPFNDDMEYGKTELFIDYTFEIGK
jgi:hypothetical protein